MNVTLRKPNSQVQILNLSPDFSLNKESMFNKNSRGSDTMQSRLADIEHDVNGPQPSMFKFSDCVSKFNIGINEVLEAATIKSLQLA